MQAGQDSEGGGVVANKCVRCMQWWCCVFVFGLEFREVASKGPLDVLIRAFISGLVTVSLWIFGEGISQNRSHPQGPKSEFKEVTVSHVVCHCSGFPGSFLSGTLLSYWTSTVARTSGRGHVTEA